MHKAATLKPFDGFPAPVNNDFRALSNPLANQGFDPRFRKLADHWPHLHALIQPEACDTGCGHLGDCTGESFLSLTNGKHERCCQTTLSSTSERAVCHDLGGHVHIGVGQDDGGIFCPTLSLDPLPI